MKRLFVIAALIVGFLIATTGMAQQGGQDSNNAPANPTATPPVKSAPAPKQAPDATKAQGKPANKPKQAPAPKAQGTPPAKPATDQEKKKLESQIKGLEQVNGVITKALTRVEKERDELKKQLDGLKKQFAATQAATQKKISVLELDVATLKESVELTIKAIKALNKMLEGGGR